MRSCASYSRDTIARPTERNFGEQYLAQYDAATYDAQPPPLWHRLEGEAAYNLTCIFMHTFRYIADNARS